MITATCRTCHQDWTLDRLPPPEFSRLNLEVVLDAPCGHGRFIGRLSLSHLVFEGRGWEPDPDRSYEWEWGDQAYMAADQAYQQYVMDHPQPVLEDWNPPPLVLLCLCGDPVTLHGTDYDDFLESWRGECERCGLDVRVLDAGDTVTYKQERWARHDAAHRAWQRGVPPVPRPVPVEHLRETRESEADSWHTE